MSKLLEYNHQVQSSNTFSRVMLLLVVGAEHGASFTALGACCVLGFWLNHLLEWGSSA